MKLRIHADELVWTGGAELAAELGARSADHLGFVSEAGMEALAAASCVATLLPAATFYLRLGHYAPARARSSRPALRWPSPPTSTPAAGSRRRCPSPWPSAASRWGSSLEEALVAVTVNAAFSLDRCTRIGSIEVGKRADLVGAALVRGSSTSCGWGCGAVRTVVKDGRVVVRDGRRVDEPRGVAS